MKTNNNALVGGIALAMLLSTSIAVAGSLDHTSGALLGATALGQSAPANDSSQDKGQQTLDLLRRARQAMSENDLATAELLISKAESLEVPYDNFHMGDTPKKARRDLERKRNAAAPTKPSQLFSPLGQNKNKNIPGNDPFAGHAIESPQGPSPARSADQPFAMTQPGENDVRAPGIGASGRGMTNATPFPSAPTSRAAPAANESQLRMARLALAVGDVRRAGESVQQARASGINYQPLDDTPDKVEASIRKFQELAGLDKSTEAYARAYARNMMEQADGLARWGEYDEAERLATRAANLRIVYGPFEQKPQSLLEKIARARRQSGNSAMAANASAPGFAGTSAPTAVPNARQQAVEWIRQAREAIAAGQLDRAESLARAAEQLGLPDSSYAQEDDRPVLVLLDIRQLKKRDSSRVIPAGGEYAASEGGDGLSNRSATRAVYDPSNDPTRNVQAGAQQGLRPDPRLAQNPNAPSANRETLPAPPPAPNPAGAPVSQGVLLMQQGEAALKAQDTARANELFRQAANYSKELDPATAQRLQERLQLLSASGARPQPPAGQPSSMTDEAAAKQQTLIRQVASDVAHLESNARSKRDTDPKASLAFLDEARKKIETSGLDSSSREQLLRRVDRAIAETKQVLEQNKPQLELADKNNRIRSDIDRKQRVKVEVQEKLAMKFDEFNRLSEEQRFEEAEQVAKQAAELDPNNPVVVQMLWQARFVHRLQDSYALRDKKEQGFIDAMYSAEEGSIPFDDRHPIVFPNDGKDWSAFAKNRSKFAKDGKRARSEQDIEIEKKLRTPVSLQFTNAPLSKVMDYLAKLAEVNLYLDPQGLAEEGVTTDTPVTIDLRHEIMLKSALHLILEPLHLSYVIKDEVLKVTSEQMRDGQVYTVTYNVAHLVIPIPNFVPGSMGLQNAYHDALGSVGTVGFGGSMPFSSGSTATPMPVVATRDGRGSGGSLNSSLMAQVANGGTHPGITSGVKNPVAGAGPGGLGGGAQADFDSLIDLITSTVKPTSWDDVGGPGSIRPFETNLSIVVSQTQEVHEEIVDLLEQLRRLQDLQVTIEVRFITLNDKFFERIGVSFDFDVNDNIDGSGVAFGAVQPGQGINYQSAANFATGQGVNRNVTNQDSNQTITVGMSSPGVFNADLDIPFTQGSYNLAKPAFGGFDPTANAGASLGFAILSDIEAYFFVTAAQGDQRSNVLQAPKVTLFNGQQAFVSDTSQSPFVISVIPVVGDFAAAQQPVIVVLSEGTFMTVQAVVSADRRFVRLTVVPFFSKIGDVKTFTFTGSTSSTSDSTREGLNSGATDPSKLWNKTGNNNSVQTTGTTVQLPTFSYVTVTTTVSVPDGGTVLLGGIKRLSEGRNEFGVPLLNKLPYINRLFKNTSIGRETQSLMMMVTPRIIIQEEEEEKLGIQSPP